MAERTTVAQVEGMARAMALQAERVGIITQEQRARLVVQQGSRTYGRAWRIYLRDSLSGGLHQMPGANGDGYLGSTAAEAWHTLATMRNVLAAVPERAS